MNPHLHAVADGEVPADGPQTMAEALQHIMLLNGELERVSDELEGETRARRAAKGEATRYKRLLEAKRKKEEREPTITRILENWRDLCALAPAQVKIVVGSKRWERIVARMDEGWSEEELLMVPTGALESDWHNGSNPSGKRYLEVDTIFRDSEQVEKFVRLAREKQDRDTDERAAVYMQEHMPEMWLALVQERQLGVLVGLEPTAFEPTPSEEKAAKKPKPYEAPWPQTSLDPFVLVDEARDREQRGDVA